MLNLFWDKIMDNESSTENEIINILFESIDHHRIKKIFTHALASTLLSNCNDSFADKSLNKSGELSQSEIIYIISVIFTNKTVFEHFLKLLPADISTVFNILIKEPIISKSQLLNQYNINAFQNFGNYYTLKDEFYLFLNKLDTKTYYLINGEEIIFNLPVKLRKRLLILTSENLDLQQYDHLPSEASTLFVFQNGEDLFDIIADIYKMLSLDKITFTKKNELSKKSEQIIKSGFNIREFYKTNDDKSLLSNLRVRTIFEYIASFSLKINGKNLDNLEIYRQLFWQRIKTKTYFRNEIPLLLKHICYFSPDTSQIEENFLILLKSFTVNKWISFSEIINYFLASDIKVFIKGGYPTFSGKNREFDLYYTSENDLKYNLLINIPFLKGIFFSFAAFGLMDIAYTIPEAIPIFQSRHNNYTSIYDGLEYIKLTQLGAYALGLTDNIDVKANINKRPLFQFNQYAMILTLDGRDPYLETLLLDYGNLISAGKYNITYEKLAKGCNSKVDLQTKINIFKKETTEQITPNWENFFQKAIKNFDCITNLDTYSVYEIEQTNIELLNLFTHDRTLQNLVVKAENYKFLVLKKNEQKLKDYLSSKGYCFSLKN